MDYSGPFLFSEIFCGTPPSCLKVMGWVVAYRILLSAPGPFGTKLGFSTNWDLVQICPGGFRTKGFGPGLDNTPSNKSYY